MTYKLIQSDYVAMSDRLDYFISKYNEAEYLEKSKENKRKKIAIEPSIEDAISKGKDVLYYYYRNIYNQLVYHNKTVLSTSDNIDICALFIILNKLCFRGIHRIGKDFNVLFGNYKNPNIPNKTELQILSNLFNKYSVDFHNEYFNTICPIKGKHPNDFYYLDPPYYPIDENSFTSYNDGGFNEIDHHNLIAYFIIISKKRHSKIMMSNSNTPFITNRLAEYTINTLVVKRRINSKNPADKVSEVLIKNF